MGGICNESGDMLIEVQEKRDKNTFIPIILRRVLPGSTINIALIVPEIVPTSPKIAPLHECHPHLYTGQNWKSTLI